MRKLIYMFISLLIISFLSCENKEKIAQENIKQYLIDNIREGTKVEFNKFSDLYILNPKDNSKIPSPDTSDYEKESAHDFGELFSLYASGLSLALEGCTPPILQGIIDNDKKFREWGTGGDEFIMICFFTGTDKYLNNFDLGVCARLDSPLNVYRIYGIKEDRAIYNMIK